MNNTINHNKKTNQPAALKAVGRVGGGLSVGPHSRAPTLANQEDSKGITILKTWNN